MSREARSKVTIRPCVSFSPSVNTSLPLKHVNLDDSRRACDLVSGGLPHKVKHSLQQPDLAKWIPACPWISLRTLKALELMTIEHTSQNFTFSYFPYAFSRTHIKHSCLGASFFPTPMLTFPQQITPVLSFTFLPLSLSLSLLFSPSPWADSPHLPSSSSVSA